ncbi:MAG: SUMF1/EgtB/PvdO family nonheme iron enzyme, partial [Spirochaetota bacterium]
EWCWDWYGEYEGGSQTDPTGATSGTGRFLRGGAWYNDENYARVGNRWDYCDPYNGRSYGFRVVRP